MTKNDNASRKMQFLPPAKVHVFVVFLSFFCHFVEIVIFLSFWCNFLKNSENDWKILRKMTEKWQTKLKWQKNDKKMTKNDKTEMTKKMTKKNDKKMTK